MPCSCEEFDSQGLVLVQDFGGGNGADLSLFRRYSASGPYVVVKTFYGFRDIDDMWIPTNKNEIEAFQQLPEHPHVVTLLGYYVNTPVKGNYTLMLEFCDLSDLSRLLGYARSVGKQIPEFFVWKVLLQILGALAFIHRRHVTHGDIAPRNLFLQSSPSGSGWPDVKVGDFGSSGFRDSKTAFDVKMLFFTISLLTETSSECVRDPESAWSLELRQCKARILEFEDAHLAEIPSARDLLDRYSGDANWYMTPRKDEPVPEWLQAYFRSLNPEGSHDKAELGKFSSDYEDEWCEEHDRPRREARREALQKAGKGKPVVEFTDDGIEW